MASRTISGMEIRNQRLERLKPVIQGWIQVVKAFADAYEGNDAIYWYGERTNIGALSAGAWLGGFVTLEEYGVEKDGAPKKRTKGRLDLYMGARGARKYDVGIEAKFLRYDTTRRIENKLIISCKDARRSRDTNIRIGSVFIAPIFKRKFHRSEIQERLSKIKKLDSDLVAWCFPGTAHDLKGDPPNHRYVHPGVVMVMKIAGPSRSKRRNG